MIANATVESLEAGAALYDARFARTVLFFLGILIVVAGVYLGITPGIVFGFITLGCGWWFQAWKVPKYERELQAARYRLAIGLERLGHHSSRGVE